MPNSQSQDGVFSLADLSMGFATYYQSILFGIVVTFVWAFFWVRFVRDEEGQALPPSFAAKLFFALSLVLVYIGLVIIGFLAPRFISGLALPILNDMPENFLRHVPLLAIIAMAAFYSIPQIKDVAQRFAIILHNAQYRKRDEMILQQHLERCGFAPSELEIDQNRNYIQQFNVYLTDRETGIIKSETIGAWRKVSTLLRIIDEDLKSSYGILSVKEREEVARIEEAHRRKTHLAMSIIRMLDQMEAHNNSEQKLTQIASLLSDASHKDRNEVLRAEDFAKQIILQLGQNGGPDFGKPLRLSSQQMREYFSQIERYFAAEYQIILRDVSSIAAKIILRAGDKAPERLDAVKASGFVGLGQIEKVNFDRVIWVLLSTWATVFAGMTFSTLLSGRQVMNPELLVRISVVVSIAVLIGAIWGSRRSLIETRTTPWSSYLIAGFIAVAGFCIVHGSRYLIDPTGTLADMAKRIPEARNWNFIDYLAQILPFAFSVFFLAIGICRLARIAQWPWAAEGGLGERLSDGLVIGLIYTAGGLAALTAHYMFGTAMGEGIRKMAESGGFPFRLLWFQGTNLVVGFIIGALIIRDVRRIAHSHVIQSPVSRKVGAGVQEVTQMDETVPKLVSETPAAGQLAPH